MASDPAIRQKIVTIVPKGAHVRAESFGELRAELIKRGLDASVKCSELSKALNSLHYRYTSEGIRIVRPFDADGGSREWAIHHQ